VGRHIDGYLDRLFDLLAGGGAAGRRVLSESEAHLLDAASAAQSRGADAEAAELEAIARFGTPEEVARAHFGAGGVPAGAMVGRLFAGAWLFASVSAIAIGISGLIGMALVQIAGPDFVAANPADTLYTAARCADFMRLVPDAGDCATAAVLHHVDELTFVPVELGVIGLMLLAGFFAARLLARRSSAWRSITTLPNAAMVSGVGAVGFGMIAFLSLMSALVRIAGGETGGTGANLATGLAALTAFAVFLPGAWRQLARGQR
jgi:hypothetical protein